MLAVVGPIAQDEVVRRSRFSLLSQVNVVAGIRVCKRPPERVYRLSDTPEAVVGAL